MGIDEFNATKDTKSKMAFIIVNQDNKNIFGINNSRLFLDIEKYFKRYSRQERGKVQFITMDLYKPYKKIKHLKARVMFIKGIYNPIKQN